MARINLVDNNVQLATTTDAADDQQQSREELAFIDAKPSTMNPFEMHKLLKRKDVERQADRLVVTANLAEDLPQGHVLDIHHWLPAASKHYNISSDLNDYVVVPIFAIPSEIPNRNGVGFPLEELTAFSPDDGMMYYQTFRGKPTHVEHVNKDYSIAKGVIADCYLRQLREFSWDRIWKMVELLMFDRTRDPDLCKDILTRKINSYSMGAMVGGYTCSYCGAQIGRCHHLHPDQKVDFFNQGGHLIYRRVQRPRGFETSAVKTPAYSVATTDFFFPVNNDVSLVDQKR